MDHHPSGKTLRHRRDFLGVVIALLAILFLSAIALAGIFTTHQAASDARNAARAAVRANTIAVQLGRRNECARTITADVDDAWRTTVASLLVGAIDRDQEHVAAEVKALEALPSASTEIKAECPKVPR